MVFNNPMGTQVSKTDDGLAVLKHLFEDPDNEESIQNCFNKYDKDKNGYLDMYEYPNFVKDVASLAKINHSNVDFKSLEHLPYEEVESKYGREIALLNTFIHPITMDANQDKKVSYQEFKDKVVTNQWVPQSPMFGGRTQVMYMPNFDQTLQQPIEQVPMEGFISSPILQEPSGGWNKKWCSATMGGSHSWNNGVCSMCKKTKEDYDKEMQE